MPASPSPKIEPPIGGEGTFCPACGYDLRGAPAERCPECGLLPDPEALRVSGLPWAHRRRMGRLRAYLRTVRQVTFGSEALALEPARPQDPRDARAFHRAHAAVLAVVLIGLFALIIWGGGMGFAVLAVQPDWLMPGMRGTDLPPWLQDFAVPWSAGATIIPVMPICLLLFAFHLTGVQRVVFRLPQSSPLVHRLRARALAAYAAAPLVFLAPAVLCIGGIVWIDRNVPDADSDRTARTTGLLLGVAATAVFLFMLITTFLRVGRWLARLRHCGFGRALLGVLELIGLWLAGAIVLLGALPWSIGFLWIVIDSLR